MTTDKRNKSTKKARNRNSERGKSNEEKNQCSYFRSSNGVVFMCVLCETVQCRLRRKSKSKLQRRNVRQLLQMVCRI